MNAAPSGAPDDLTPPRAAPTQPCAPSAREAAIDDDDWLGIESMHPLTWMPGLAPHPRGSA